MVELTIQTENSRRDERVVRFNPGGLTDEEFAAMHTLGVKLLGLSAERFKYILSRCTYFADSGIDVLRELVSGDPRWANPRIEGCDANPFDQHYWLAANLVRATSVGHVIFDPIFGYVGLLPEAPTVLDSVHMGYYRDRRVVPPHQQFGGVRIKTIGI